MNMRELLKEMGKNECDGDEILGSDVLVDEDGALVVTAASQRRAMLRPEAMLVDCPNPIFPSKLNVFPGVKIGCYNEVGLASI